MKPWTVMPKDLNGLRYTIVGFGEDYMLITMEDGCPGCTYTKGIDAMSDMLVNINCIFIGIGGVCCPRHPENHIYLTDNEARRLFPEADKYWQRTQADNSVCPKTFDEFKTFYREGHDLTPVQEDNSNRKIYFQVTGSTCMEWIMGASLFRVMPDGGEVIIIGNTVTLLNWGYQYFPGVSPIRLDPETIYEAAAVKFSDEFVSFIDTKNNVTYSIQDLKIKK